METVYPKISIVTPSYNQGRFIADAIDSVLQQNYPNFEHIIIDGGSTDNTVEILKQYPHLIWVTERDEGQSDAINKGLKRATGDIIGWLNTDDFYMPDTFFTVASELADEKTDAVYSNSRYVDVNKNVTSEQIVQNSVKWMSLFKCFTPSETFFFKRKIIDDGIIIDKEFDMAMDMELFAHIYYAGYAIKKVNAFFGHFRWHENNKSMDTKPVRLIQLKEGLTIFNRYSGYRLRQNAFNIFLYKNIVLMCGLYRRVCRTFSIGIYKM